MKKKLYCAQRKHTLFLELYLILFALQHLIFCIVFCYFSPGLKHYCTVHEICTMTLECFHEMHPKKKKVVMILKG